MALGTATEICNFQLVTFIKEKPMACKNYPVIGEAFQILWLACGRLSELNS